MNKINDLIDRYKAIKNERLIAGLRYYYMDGCPSDFDFKVSGHTLALVASENRSNLLLHSTEDGSVFKFGKMRAWKGRKEEVIKYRNSIRNALKIGRVNCTTEVNILRFSMDFLMKNKEKLRERHVNEEKYRENVVEYEVDGVRKLKLIKCPDDFGCPITISEDRILLLMLWSEFIIMIHERIKMNSREFRCMYDGLVVCSDFISGDDIGNKCKMSNVVRALLNDAYVDEITFVNSNPAISIVGDYFADNMASYFNQFSLEQIIKMPINEQKTILNVYTPRHDFFFDKIR